MKEGHIFTDIPIDLEYPNYIESQIRNIGDVDKIVHHISSPGGSVYAGYKAYHILKRTGKPIKSIVEGEAQSMATFIAMAGDEIVIMNPSRWMIHNPHQETFGDSGALQSAADELRRIETEMAEVYAKRTGKPIDQIREMMKKETKMSAQEAVNFGFCDSLIDKRIDKTVYETLRAAALGKTMEKDVNGLIDKIEEGFKKIEGFFKKSDPKAMDLALKDGKMLNVASEDGDLVGKPATVDGVAAPDGAHELADGRVVVTVGGVVTEVTEPETPEQKAQKEIDRLKAQLAAANAEKEAKEAEAKQAAEQVQLAAKATEEIKAQFEEIKKKTVGNEEPPSRGKTMEPVAIGKQVSPQAMSIAASRTYIADHMPWLEQHYAGGKYKDGTRFSDYRSGGPNAVSILETSLNYTWNGVLSTDLFFKPTLGSPALADIFTIDLGASDKKRYHIAPTFNKVLKPYTGCGQPVTGSSFDITSKAIQLKPFQMYEGWCKDDFTSQLQGSYNVLAQEWLKTGTESFDPAGTPIDRIIMDGLKDALRRDIFRRVSFGRSGAASADYNQITGLWTNLIDQSGASNYCVYASKSNFGTGALGTSAAYNELVAIYKNSSNLLKQEAIDGGKGRFLVTRSIWENLYDTYTGTGAVTELAFKQAMDGIPGQLTFRGIPVIPVTIWDDFLTDPNNPLFATTRHLIAFTIKDNHILGVENTADLNKIDSWFEKKDNKRYYRSNMVMGFLGAIHCDLTTISY